jgi:hypothetical protein
VQDFNVGHSFINFFFFFEALMTSSYILVVVADVAKLQSYVLRIHTQEYYRVDKMQANKYSIY